MGVAGAAVVGATDGGATFTCMLVALPCVGMVVAAATAAAFLSAATNGLDRRDAAAPAAVGDAAVEGARAVPYCCLAPVLVVGRRDSLLAEKAEATAAVLLLLFVGEGDGEGPGAWLATCWYDLALVTTLALALLLAPPCSAVGAAPMLLLSTVAMAALTTLLVVLLALEGRAEEESREGEACAAACDCDGCTRCWASAARNGLERTGGGLGIEAPFDRITAGEEEEQGEETTELPGRWWWEESVAAAGRCAVAVGRLAVTAAAAAVVRAAAAAVGGGGGARPGGGGGADIISMFAQSRTAAGCDVCPTVHCGLVSPLCQQRPRGAINQRDRPTSR